MFEKLEVFQMAGAMAKHAAARQALIAENIAQADTPGYKARDIASFSDTYRSSNESLAMRATRSGHLADSALPQYRITETAGNGNSVSLETEMMKSAVVRQEHDMALAIYKSALGVLRSSLGRR